MIKVSASVACANFAHLERDVRELEEGGVDILHFDVVDGVFATTFALSPVILRSLRRLTNIPFDVHLAVNYPGRYIKEFVEAGSDVITVHIKAQDDLRQVIREIKAFDNKTGVALMPSTPLSALKESILDEIDMVLLMTVNPGFAGQDFNYSVISKIQELKKIIERRGLRTDIEVDGGINEKTIPLVVRAGANVLVGGSTSIFSGKKDIVTSVKLFRDEAEKWIPKKGN